MVKFSSKAALAAVALATVTLPAAADATTYNNFNGFTGTFGNDVVKTTAGAFSDVFTFVLPSAGTSSSSILSSRSSAASDVDFTSVRLTGPNGFLSNFATVSSGVFEFRTFGPSTMAGGTYTLTVNGTSGSAASYSGDFTFSPAAVPEPATWALMIGGVSFVGMSLRRRRAATNRLAVA